MSSSNVPVTPGTGKNVATYSFTDQDTVSKDLGRVTLNDFQGTAIGSALNPLIINPSGSIGIYFDRGNPSVNIGGFAVTMATYFDQSNPAVTAYTLDGTTKRPLRANSDGAIKIYDLTAGTVSISNAPTVTGITNTVLVAFDRGEPAVRAYGLDGATSRPLRMNSDGAIKVYDLAQGTVSISNTPTIAGITSSVAVYFDRGNPSVNVGVVNVSATASVASGGGTVSGTFNGVSTLGQTLVAPSASYNFKVYAVSLTTTAQVHLSAKFTNGAGSATEFWRYGLQAPSQGIAGANLSVTPPGYLFATGVNTTLALVLDSASLVHYSVAYFKEST